ncbi:MAG TPA: AAA family ATPase [Patescibacteria group bacterium]|nr:AAA family ATPase [Patescibacteria group bacterium]
MNATAAAVVGREAELDAIDAFLAERSALPAALAIDGPAGAGKSTLWQAAVDRATEAGFIVLACRPAGAEAQLSYAALADLLEDHLEAVLPSLPAPQRRALEVALLLENDDAAKPDQRAISAGTLSAIRALARERPVAIAIDDAQWLDPPSADAITFALRRLRDAPVAALTAWRVTSPSVPAASPPPGRAGLERAFERAPIRIDVGPLSLGALNRLLRTRTSLEFNRRTLQRIHETSGGNPFYALELARAMESAPDGASTEPLALGSSLTDLLAERLHGLTDATRDALFVAAALSQSRLDRIAAALGGTEEATASRLAPAAKAGILRVAEGAVEFAHPLFAAAAYAALSPEDRRRWHAHIADTALDSETRARHAALATSGPDANAAALLHAAAADALARGAPGVAAELFLAALERRPAAADRVERALWILEAGPVIQSNGALDQARSLVESAIEDLPHGPDRSEGLRLLGELLESEPDGFQRSLDAVEQAIEEAGSDARRRAAALLDREMMERPQGRLDLALPIARRALAAAEESGDLFLQAHGQVRVADLETLLGLAGDDPIPRFARAEELDRQVHVDAENSAPVMLSVCLIRMGRLDEARTRLLDGKRRASAEGDERGHQQICLFLAELEWLAGNWDAAATYAAEGLEIAEQAGLRLREGSTTGLVALVQASRGDADLARATAERGIAISDEVGDVGYGRYTRQILAFLDLSLGDAAAAARSLDSYAIGHAIEGPKRIAFIGDAIEALVQLGDIERAATLTDELAARGAHIHRPPMTAAADRCRALVLAARGDTAGAIAAAEAAIAVHDRLRLPFEAARSRLVLGEVQRRAKQRKAARETLDQAIAGFEALGARLWVDRARAEQARIGGRTTIEGLSETELRVAQLVAEGRSNKEVAAALFVSVRAVEANLSRIYAKLGIESRTELARRF